MHEYTTGEQSNSRRQIQQQIQQQQFSTSKNSKTSDLSDCSSRLSEIEDIEYQNTNTVVKRGTPILFSTNRGLHLRMAKAFSFAASTNTNYSNQRSGRSGSAYDIKFCDLERWSTNHANRVSLLEDSDVIHKFSVTKPTHTECGCSAKQCTTMSQFVKNEGSKCCNISGIPVKRSVVRFNKTFRRFDTSN
ncbi:uncharacterized protein LOC119683909 [Teleopsis dalmanni]|uniref:uncharacterized protein LOC119683909 n=1 Tax=Teleopsis dalmanni TaxID=139649 RepID=UPI0018CEE9CA|nr:uncharacterized protein LOC119683909 [Teleopsis dalmanni]